MKRVFLLLFLCLPFVWASTLTSDTSWTEYNGDGARSHYSALKEINTGNVGQLKPAWTFRSQDADTLKNRSQVQCNPIIIDGILYGVSAATQAFAVDAHTGKLRWENGPDR